VSTTLTRCPSCGRDTQTTEDWRCEYCGQPKPVAAEPVEPEGPPQSAPSLWEDLRPQFAAAGLSLVIAVVGLIIGSALLLIAAAAVLVAAVLAEIVADGW
jgi:hypothetical protein